MTKGFQALKDIGECLLLKGVLDDINQERIGFIAKELRALEIIKTKKVNIKCIISGWLLGKYNSYKAHISLTQEEYDLLKEILL